jgi:hypothetical protein
MAMHRHKYAWSLAVAVALALSVAWRAAAVPRAPAVTRACSAALTPPAAVRGGPSCSARACHGSLRPVPDGSVNRDEFTVWLTRDRHARAYQVLGERRSQDIVRRLGRKERPDEYGVCLACHTNPVLAGTAHGPGREELAEERSLGVGCESCHGAAEQWYAPHTARAWADQTPAEKAELGLRPLADLCVRAATCAGCHVGAPAGDGLPRRDVNHDLIAAGHPRLDFELADFLRRMPQHWRERPGAGGTAYAAQVWAVGQVVSARAALDLLRDRAATAERPWPEFADYDCFACHHNLQSPSGRQRPGRDAPLGQPRRGRWYVAVPGLLSGDRALGDNGASATALRDVAAAMRGLNPERESVARAAKTAVCRLTPWGVKLAGTTPRLGDVAKFKVWLAGREELTGGGWDERAQLYLALRTLGGAAPDARACAALDRLFEKLAFRRGYSSPRERPAGSEGVSGLEQLFKEAAR